LDGSQQAKDVLNDIAAQSKKGFNAIFSKLGGDKGDTHAPRRIAPRAHGTPVTSLTVVLVGRDRQSAVILVSLGSFVRYVIRLMIRQSVSTGRLSPRIIETEKGQAADFGC
jgi:hypothetical protein